MSPITQVEDAPAYLTTPSEGSHGDYIWKLRASAGLIIGGVDAVVEGFTHFSPLNEWIVKPFGGDWKALDKGAEAWTNAGKAAHAIELNLKSVPGQIGDDWQGATAEAFKKKQVEVAEAIAPLQGACDGLSEMCSALAELARTIGEFVVEVLKAIVDRAIKIIATSASVVAAPAAPPLILELCAKVFGWSKQVVEFIQEFIDAVKHLVHVAEIIVKVIEHLWKVLKPYLEFKEGQQGAGVLAGTGVSGGGGGGGGGGGF